MEECEGALADLVAEGKILHFGLSNETAWGTMQWLLAAQRTGGPPVQTLQNEYSLLCRLADTDLAELLHHERVTLLAYTPLAAGLLTGKYQGGAVPPGSRMDATPDLGGRRRPRAFAAVEAYLEIARRHDMDPVHLALGFVLSRPFPVIPIIGATDLGQLARAIGAAGVTLSPEVLKEVAEAHRAHPMPF